MDSSVVLDICQNHRFLWGGEKYASQPLIPPYLQGADNEAAAIYYPLDTDKNHYLVRFGISPGSHPQKTASFISSSFSRISQHG